MRLLLDTHALLWYWVGDPLLSEVAKNAVRDPANLVLVSPVSALELSTKYYFGKLPNAAGLVRDFRPLIVRYRMDELGVRIEHALRAGSYSKEHRDPFDRMLAAQAELEDAALVTRDPAFAHFPCRTLW